MWTTTLLGAICLIVITKYITDRKRRLRTFTDQRIRGPPPSFIWGNFHDLSKGFVSMFAGWAKCYGKTFGYFEGNTPVLVTSDLDILKNVLIKHFRKFDSRQFSVFYTPDESIIHVKGPLWTRLRKVISPAFTAKRMKGMSPLINNCVQTLLDHLQTKAGTSFNIMDDLQRLTLDVIACCAFGLELDSLKHPDNIFLKQCKTATKLSGLRPPFYFPVLALLVFLFPRLAPIARLLMPNIQVPKEITKWFRQTIAAVLEQRRRDRSPTIDLIQLLLSSQNQHVGEGHTIPEEGHRNPTPEEGYCILNARRSILECNGTKSVGGDKGQHKTNHETKKKGLTEAEIEAQCMTFLLAGYETMASAIAFTIYELACHPDIQCKLQQEIDHHLPGPLVPEYRSLQKLTYLDMVFCEILRLYDISGFAVIRKCNNDVNMDGVYLPKGSIVRTHIAAVHMDPESWGPEDPSQFVPERFLPERKANRNPLAWLPFGAGPRNCVGMRFSIFEAKITLVHILKKFNIHTTKDTVVPLKVSRVGIMKPKDGVFVQLENRNEIHKPI